MRRGIIVCGLLAMALLPLVLSSYFLTLLDYIGMSALAALGLVLLTGVGGLTSFGQAAFVGIGAYTTAWWTTTQGGSPWIGLLLALAATGVVATVLGLATLRLSGHLLPMSTIAWGLALFFLFGTVSVTGGHDGMSGIPPVRIGELSLRSGIAACYLVWVVLGLAMLLCANLLDSRQGRAIRSLRGGLALAESLGVNSFRLRLAVFVLAGLLAGLSGWLFAHVQRYVSPGSFDVGTGMDYLFMAMLGGAGHIFGAVLGAALVTLGHDVLQDVLPRVTASAGQIEIVVFGAAFILVLHRTRGGLIPAVLRLLPPHIHEMPQDAPPLTRRAPPLEGSTVLEVAGLTRRFGGLVAVDEMGFSLMAGQILGLIGPNGAGKSTLFNLVCGATVPDAGRVRLLGQDITGLSARHVAERGLARSFQHVRLRPDMSVLENVMLGAHLRLTSGLFAGALRLDRAEERGAQAEAMRQLRRVGLDEFAHAPAGSLPLGRQRILEVARALAADPLLIVLDEPAAGLRRAEKQALAALLDGLRHEGMTVLLVEHDMEFVMGLVDRIVVMAAGRLIAEGAPAAIRADARVQDAYLGAAA